MLWTSKRRKSRPDIHPKSPQSQPHRRSSLGSQRLPFAPLDLHQAKDMPDPQSLYARQILSPDEQNRGALQNDSYVASLPVQCSSVLWTQITDDQPLASLRRSQSLVSLVVVHAADLIQSCPTQALFCNYVLVQPKRCARHGGYDVHNKFPRVFRLWFCH